LLVLDPHRYEVHGQIRLGDGWEHREPIFVALAATDGDLIGGEVDVLGAEPATLEHPEPSAVEQAGHEARHPLEPLEHGADFVAGEDDWQPVGALCAHEPGEVDVEDVAIQE
jgi:hypothetical protein